MNTKKKTIIAIIIFLMFLGLSYFAYSALSSHYKVNNEKNAETTSSTQEANKTLAPDFYVFDKNGKKANLSDYRGKPVVINLWASWCPPCKAELPHFNEVYQAKKNDVVFMMIDLTDGQRETKDKGEDYIKNMGYKFPLYFDTDLNAADMYSISSIPTTLFIDKDGYIVKGYQGAIDRQTLEDGIKAIQER